MTNVELYDLAIKNGVKEPAVFFLGTRCILGKWVEGDELTRSLKKMYRLLFSTNTKAIAMLAEGDTWDECAAKRGWLRASA